MPHCEDLAAHALGPVLVAVEGVDNALVEDVGEYVLNLWMVLIDVCGEEPARVFATVASGEGEGAFVDGAAVDAQVLYVYFLVVDVAGESKVDGTRGTECSQDVVFPLDGGLEAVGLAASREDFLDDGDVIECRGVDDDTQDGIVGRRGELYVEEFGIRGPEF